MIIILISCFLCGNSPLFGLSLTVLWNCGSNWFFTIPRCFYTFVLIFLLFTGIHDYFCGCCLSLLDTKPTWKCSETINIVPRNELQHLLCKLLCIRSHNYIKSWWISYFLKTFFLLVLILYSQRCQVDLVVSLLRKNSHIFTDLMSLYKKKSDCHWNKWYMNIIFFLKQKQRNKNLLTTFQSG